MRIWAVIVLIVGTALPGLAQQQVSVAQLETILTADRTSPDADLAAKLSELILTERFSAAHLEHWRSQLPGPRSERALLGVADRSAFLNPPSSEIPPTPAPNFDEQKRIMGLAATYVTHSIPQLPNFYATRTITQFEEAPPAGNQDAGSGPIHAMRITRATIQYQNGEESSPASVKVKNQQSEQGLTTWGAFGPILGLVLLDAARSNLAWEHWEQQAAQPLAVFRYKVPAALSHYEVRYCCIVYEFGLESTYFREMSGYHGQITVDPATGVIRRVTLEADIKPGNSITHAAIAVEYGPVELGGATVICPVHSVSLSLAKTVRQAETSDGRLWNTMGPLRLLLNHADYDQYHVFRGQTRILSASEERTAGMAPDATLPAPPPPLPLPDTRPTEEVLADAPISPANASPLTGVVLNPSAASGETAEITTAAATGLPDQSPNQTNQTAATPEGQPNGFRLHITARLVDVNVVALDKKGRPIPNLKPEDFEVYDNGIKQKIGTFNHAGGDNAPPASPAAAAPAVQQAAFSNHPAPAAKDAPEPNTLVLLVDPANLVYNDLVDARRQMIHFLQQLPATDRVALYSMSYHGYEILQEATLDHQALALRLQKWMPTAQDLLNARDEEDRNRQKMETVHNLEDMLSVNGNVPVDPFTQTQALDPKLRELGSNPSGNALLIMVDVAHHLAAIPGHKSLVWVTSDNALADWNNSGVTIDKHSKVIEPIALHTQEAMNNAHVSVYPLDASRLEASVTTADVGRRNVELTPTYQAPPAGFTAQVLATEPNVGAGTDADPNHPFAQARNWNTNSRLYAQMEQDTHGIQGVFREVAQATGGQAFRRSSNIEGELGTVVADGDATYMLGFSPSTPADDHYHLLTVKLVGHKDASLRYRTGYQYDKEPTTLKQRFTRAIWEPTDSSEISITTRPVSDAAGKALRVTVAGSDLTLAQQAAHWTGKLDIFLVRRDEEGRHARVTGETLGLNLKPVTYEHALKDGLTFDERVDATPDQGSLRVVVVDTASGRIGSVTVPSSALLQ